MQGFLRSDGRKGIRNVVAVAYLVECAHHVAREIATPFRERGVRLLAPGEGIPARILDLRFLGDVALVEMAVQGLDAPLFARVRESDAPQVGSEIGIGVDEGAVLVLEENGNRLNGVK